MATKVGRDAQQTRPRGGGEQGIAPQVFDRQIGMGFVHALTIRHEPVKAQAGDAHLLKAPGERVRLRLELWQERREPGNRPRQSR